MTLSTSKRGIVPPFHAMDVMRKADRMAAEGRRVFHLEAGQPGTPAPQGVLRRAEALLRDDNIGYTQALGLTSVRERIARHYSDQYGVDVSPGRIMMTAGSSGGFHLSFTGVFDVGDTVAMALPCYPAYRNMLMALGADLVLLETELSHGFQPTVEQLQALDCQLRGLIVASPSNPTGSMLSRDGMTALTAYCASRGIWFISDEIYHGITYGKRPTTALEVSDQAIVLNSFSKYFSMTGWRIGWAVLPEELVRPFECLAQNFFISPPTLAQLACAAAFDCKDELDGHVAHYARNRQTLLDALSSAGVDRIAPADGAFYIYADVSHLTDDSAALCARVLEQTGVAITPGVDFDPVRGHHFIRLSYAGAEPEVTEAAGLLNTWLHNKPTQ